MHIFKKFATLEWIFKDQRTKSQPKASRKVKLHLPKKAPKDTLPIPVSQRGKMKEDRFTENTKVMQKKQQQKIKPTNKQTQTG